MRHRRQTAVDDGSTPESDAVVLSARLGAKLSLELDEFFDEWGITGRQFNILRILYVRDPDRRGISRGALEARLVWRMPDVTRLLDRLAAGGLITRHRPANDQRTVLATLTDQGWDLVEKSHGPLLRLNRSQFAHMSRKQVLELIALLRKALNRPPERTADAAE
jgi:DNA-binding MarR family transcriptional regulator